LARILWITIDVGGGEASMLRGLNRLHGRRAKAAERPVKEILYLL
jgi:hypothetical protein